jgi:hypothetical protein
MVMTTNAQRATLFSWARTIGDMIRRASIPEA